MIRGKLLISVYQNDAVVVEVHNLIFFRMAKNLHDFAWCLSVVYAMTMLKRHLI